MKVIAYTALLYGTDYLGWAIRSVIDHIDELHIIYDSTGHGSHGHRTERECPDSRWELINIATNAAGDKLRWHDGGPYSFEGQQRDAIYGYAPDADVILVLDSDEIWPDGLAQATILQVMMTEARTYRIPIIHYWRSFHRCVLHDPAFPVRAIVPSRATDEWCIDYKPINHMGYAQRSEIVNFKLTTHGHRGEFRRDVDWFNDVFVANRQTDCHPVGSEYWNPETVNPLDYMPIWMKDHPYFNLDVIP